ncbi:MAG: hypothetical protein ACKO3P_01090, partial [Planctomycetaceae bacterium]
KGQVHQQHSIGQPEPQVHGRDLSRGDLNVGPRSRPNSGTEDSSLAPPANPVTWLTLPPPRVY